MSAPTFHVVRFSCQGLPHNAILPHRQHPQQRKHRPDSPQRVCQKRDSKRKNSNAFRFWHDAALVFSRRSSPAAMLDSPLPTRRQGDIRLPSQAASDRDLRSVSRSRAVRLLALPFDKAGCLSYTWQVGVLQRLVRQLARFSRRAEDESNGFLRLAATGWALFSRPNDASGSRSPLRGCPGHDSRFPAHLRSCWPVSRFIQPRPHPYPGCPWIVQCPCG